MTGLVHLFDATDLGDSNDNIACNCYQRRNRIIYWGSYCISLVQIDRNNIRI
jgi:hypothetical protein